GAVHDLFRMRKLCAVERIQQILVLELHREGVIGEHHVHVGRAGGGAYRSGVLGGTAELHQYTGTGLCLERLNVAGFHIVGERSAESSKDQFLGGGSRWQFDEPNKGRSCKKWHCIHVERPLI